MSLCIRFWIQEYLYQIVDIGVTISAADTGLSISDGSCRCICVMHRTKEPVLQKVAAGQEPLYQTSGDCAFIVSSSASFSITNHTCRSLDKKIICIKF